MRRASRSRATRTLLRWSFIIACIKVLDFVQQLMKLDAIKNLQKATDWTERRDTLKFVQA